VLAVYLFVFQGSVTLGSTLWGFIALRTSVHIQRRIYDLAGRKSRADQGQSADSLQPQTNPKYQFVNALYSSLALFETTNRVLQLVENTLIASLITQRSLVQIQPPQRNSFVFNDLQELATTRICS